MELVKPTGNITLGRHRYRWKDNIEIDLKEIGINTKNWVDSSQDRDYWRALENAALNLQVPYAMELVKPTGKTPLKRPKHRLKDNTGMELKEIRISTKK